MNLCLQSTQALLLNFLLIIMLLEYKELRPPSQQMRETNFCIKWNCLGGIRQFVLVLTAEGQNGKRITQAGSEKVPILLHSVAFLRDS